MQKEFETLKEAMDAAEKKQEIIEAEVNGRIWKVFPDRCYECLSIKIY